MNLGLGVLPFIERCMLSSFVLFVNVHGPPQHLSIRFLFCLAMFAILPPLFM